MAFTLNLPTINNLVSFLFPMRIYEKDNYDNTLPCTIMEINENRNYGIPDEPLDDNTIINDTIYKLPKTLSVRVFVNTLNLNSFENALQNLQYGSGFTITGKDGQFYENYRLESVTTAQTASVEGAYFYDLAFKEIRLITSFATGIPILKASNAGYASKEQVGEVANSAENKQTFLKNVLGDFDIYKQTLGGGF